MYWVIWVDWGSLHVWRPSWLKGYRVYLRGVGRFFPFSTKMATASYPPDPGQIM